MSGVADFLFGGSDTSQQQQQAAANAQARGDISARAGQARSDALNLVPLGDINRNLGFQSALDVLGQSAPQQLSTFQQGNINAQNALLGGLPQFQNALLGGQVDLGSLQPQQVTFDPSFLQQQLPSFGGSVTTGGGVNTPINAALAQMLGGSGNFNQANQQDLTGNGPAGLGGSPVIDRNLENQFGLNPDAIDTTLQVASLLGVPVVGIGRDFANLGTADAAEAFTQGQQTNSPVSPPSFFDRLFSSPSFREQAKDAVIAAKAFAAPSVPNTPQLSFREQNAAAEAASRARDAQFNAAREASRADRGGMGGRGGFGSEGRGGSEGTRGGRGV